MILTLDKLVCDSEPGSNAAVAGGCETQKKKFAFSQQLVIMCDCGALSLACQRQNREKKE